MSEMPNRSIRLPSEMWTHIQTLAEKDQRSLNDWLRLFLARSLPAYPDVPSKNIPRPSKKP